MTCAHSTDDDDRRVSRAPNAFKNSRYLCHRFAGRLPVLKGHPRQRQGESHPPINNGGATPPHRDGSQRGQSF